jgi:hypothetical protein
VRDDPAGLPDDGSMSLPGLTEVAARYADTILAAVRREYPNAPRHTMDDPDDTVTPRQAHPAFYGCFDWHSAVEMHWALVRMLRVVPQAVDQAAVRTVLSEHLTVPAGEAEAGYFRRRPAWERPYGWGWALALVAELEAFAEDPDAGRWAEALHPLAQVLADGLVSWLPTLAYPERVGMHSNTAFALSRALPYAHHRAASSDTRLLDAIVAAARRLYLADRDYPAAWEPGGADFLSGALTEAELMLAVLPRGEFPGWLSAFLRGLVDRQPASLFTPAMVIDPTDGQGAHLYGLNLHRAYGFQLVAGRLAPGDPRIPVLVRARDDHAAASLPAVASGDWMVEHWLAAYAVLLLAG